MVIFESFPELFSKQQAKTTTVRKKHSKSDVCVVYVWIYIGSMSKRRKKKIVVYNLQKKKKHVSGNYERLAFFISFYIRHWILYCTKQTECNHLKYFSNDFFSISFTNSSFVRNSEWKEREREERKGSTHALQPTTNYS